MITNKKQLKFYLAADRVMNRGKLSLSMKERFKQLIFPDYIMKYLIALRKEEYYYQTRRMSIGRVINAIRYKKLGLKLGFSISINVFGYGLVIPHYGTIVVGAGNEIGNYAVLHTSTCITAGEKKIGDAFYLSTGAKVIHNITLGDGVSVAANSVINKSNILSNVLLVGSPAIAKKEVLPWYIRDGEVFKKRVETIEKMKMDFEI